MNNLLFGDNASLHHFFSFNTEPIPNWTGHIILSFFNFFLPAFMAEKILLLFYFIALPLSFRNLVKTISPGNYFLCYLIFPFTYSFPFYLGFYNFCLAIVFLFFTLNYWLVNSGRITFPKAIVLFLLIGATYFSHLFVFGILVFILGLHIVAKSISGLFSDNINYKSVLKDAISKSVILFLTSLLFLALAFLYFYLRPPFHGNNIYISHDELMSWIVNIRPKIALSFVESKYTKKLFYLISILFIIAVFNKINSIDIQKNINFSGRLKLFVRAFFVMSDFWLLITFILFLLYSTLPDSDGVAGYISVRIGLLFFMFLIIWLCAQTFPKWLLIFSLIIILAFNFLLLKPYFTTAADLNRVAIECNNASEFIDANSIVLPVNYSDNWLQLHFSNYLGIDKPMVILENYECALNWVPLKWNAQATIPNVAADINADRLCSRLTSDKEIDFIFVLGNLESKSDSGSVKLKNILSDKFDLSYSSANTKLYKNKEHVVVPGK